MKPTLDTPVKTLEFSVRAVNALDARQITVLRDLEKYSPNEFRTRTKYCGIRTLQEIRDFLLTNGLAVQGWTDAAWDLPVKKTAAVKAKATRPSNEAIDSLAENFAEQIWEMVDEAERAAHERGFEIGWDGAIEYLIGHEGCPPGVREWLLKLRKKEQELEKRVDDRARRKSSC